MANVIALSSADSQLLTNVLQEAIFTAQEKSIAGGIYTVYDMTGTPGLTAQIPVYPTVTASTPGQTADLESAAMTVTQVDISASEIGARVDVTDLLAESSARNMASDVGVMLGNALAEKIDSEAFSIITEANIAQDVGDNEAAVTPENILQAVYTLRGQNAPTDADGDYMCVLTPNQAFNVAKVLTENGFSSSSGGALSNVGNSLLQSSAYIGRLYNVKIFQSTALPADSVPADANGFVASPQAFGHVLKRPIRVETQRDASARTTEYVATTARGNAVLKANYAVRVKGSNTLSA